jgi:hypothetical protein
LIAYPKAELGNYSIFRDFLSQKSIEMSLRCTHHSGDHKKAAADAIQTALAGVTEKHAKTV